MSIARSFLLLSAGLVAGGIVGVALVDGEIDWLRYIRARSADRVAQPAALPAPAAAPNFRLGVTAPPPPAAEPVPETVVVSVPSSSAPTALRTRPIGARQISLAQELQGELQRVGCYGGPVDGTWTPLSQRAMRAFVTGVNANLPVDEPDYALLALVRASRGTICAKPCLPEQRGVADACAAAKPAPATTPAALTRSTIAASPAPGNPQAPPQQASQPATAPDAAAGATQPVPLAVPAKRKAAQPKSGPGGFGPDIFKALFKSIY